MASINASWMARAWSPCGCSAIVAGPTAHELSSRSTLDNRTNDDGTPVSPAVSRRTTSAVSSWSTLVSSGSVRSAAGLRPGAGEGGDDFGFEYPTRFATNDYQLGNGDEQSLGVSFLVATAGHVIGEQDGLTRLAAWAASAGRFVAG